MKDDEWLSKRRKVVAAFWAIVLLGIPCWYLTTQVSRATLPVIPTFDPVLVTVPIALEGIQEFSAHKLTTGLNLLQNVHRFANSTISPFSYVIKWNEAATFFSGLSSGKREWLITSSQAQSQNLEESIMAYMLKIFEDEASRINSLTNKALSAPDLRVVKYSPAYEIVVSLMNGNTDRPIKFWEIEKSLDKIMRPLVDEVSCIANFTLESQIQFHAELTFEPQFNETANHHVLQKSDLKNFINSAEWNLASAQSEHKPLNFVIYIPRPEHRPLLIMDQGHPVPTNSFVLPQFGSIVIYNPPLGTEQEVMNDEVLESLLAIFAQHLLTLLGMPAVPLAFGDAGIWQMDGLIRQRLVETIVSAQETLISIPKIVDQIPNMHVPAHVATLVEEALERLGQARERMNIGDIRQALYHSREAVRKAEQAFFDEKMVSLLYFPDEHKYGVYMPLFGPLLLPLFMAAIREFKAIRTNRTQKEKKPHLKSS